MTELEQLRAAAIERYAVSSDNDIEIDELKESDVSRGDIGVWVRAWVWIPDKEAA